jgi:hypothetical protein
MQTLYAVLGWLFGGVEITEIIWPRWEDLLVSSIIAAAMVFVWQKYLVKQIDALVRLQRIKDIKQHDATNR